MKKSIKIATSFILIITGLVLFLVPITLLDPFFLLHSKLGWLPALGFLLIMFGLAILLIVFIPKKYRQTDYDYWAHVWSYDIWNFTLLN